MPKRSPIALNPQEHREDAPPGWTEVQDGVAESCGLAVLLVDGHQPPAIAISNNNSICQTLQSSADYATLCDPYCGVAHSRAIKAGGAVEYECHAGLHCVAKPVEIGNSKRKLAVIGGRAFVKSADYQRLMERFRTGDLQNLATSSEDVFSNILFAEQQRLDELVERIEKAARRFRSAKSNGSALTEAPAKEEPRIEQPRPEVEEELQRLRNELEYRSRFADSLQHFLERISGPDPAKTYESIVA